MLILRWKKILTSLITLIEQSILPIESIKKTSEFESKKELILDGLENSADALEVIQKVLLIVKLITEEDEVLSDYFPNNLLTSYEEEEVAAELEKLKTVHEIMKNYMNIKYVYLKPKQKQSFFTKCCFSKN